MGRIDLARHDRRPGLVFRQLEFSQARARAGAQETDVVGDLHQRDGHGVEGARGFDDGVVGGQGLELVLGADERVPGHGGDLGGEGLGEIGVGIEAGAHRGAALGQLQESGQGGLDALDPIADLGRVAREFLAQGQGRGVLGMGAPDFYDVGEGPRLFIKSGEESAEGR